MKNNLKQFYETLNEDIPFEELSHTAICIIELSDAYKSYLNDNNKAMSKWLDSLKYIGNVLLCGFMAILFVILAYWHIMNNDNYNDKPVFESNLSYITISVINDSDVDIQKGDVVYIIENEDQSRSVIFAKADKILMYNMSGIAESKILSGENGLVSIRANAK